MHHSAVQSRGGKAALCRARRARNPRPCADFDNAPRHNAGIDRAHDCRQAASPASAGFRIGCNSVAGVVPENRNQQGGRSCRHFSDRRRCRGSLACQKASSSAEGRARMPSMNWKRCGTRLAGAVDRYVVATRTENAETPVQRAARLPLFPSGARRGRVDPAGAPAANAGPGRPAPGVGSAFASDRATSCHQAG